MLRGMVKSRRESVALYRQGNRPDLVAKEEAEIALIEAFLPPPMDAAPMAGAVAAAIAETGAAAMKDMGRVMAALKARHGAALDLAPRGAAGAREARRLMALPAAFLDELRARTPLAAIIGRRVKLARVGPAAGRAAARSTPRRRRVSWSMRTVLSLLRLRRAWRRHRLRHAVAGRRLPRGGRAARRRVPGWRCRSLRRRRRRPSGGGSTCTACWKRPRRLPAPAVPAGRRAARSPICAGAASPTTPSAASGSAGRARAAAR